MNSFMSEDRKNTPKVRDTRVIKFEQLLTKTLEHHAEKVHLQYLTIQTRYEPCEILSKCAKVALGKDYDEKLTFPLQTATYINWDDNEINTRIGYNGVNKLI